MSCYEAKYIPQKLGSAAIKETIGAKKKFRHVNNFRFNIFSKIHFLNDFW